MAHSTFRTHDGVELSRYDNTWYCYKNGINLVTNDKDIPTMSYIDELSNDHDAFYYFSTEQACQQYIDKTIQPVIFTTEDGVDMREEEEYWGIDLCHKIKEIEGPFICSDFTDFSGKMPNYLCFSSESKAQEYLDDLNKPVVFTTNDGVPMRDGDEFFILFNQDLTKEHIKNAKKCIIKAYCTTWNGGYTDRLYFSTFEKAEEYINSLKPVEPTVVELPKSELEMAYDTLVALCAKYGTTGIVIHKNEQFPVSKTFYSITVELDNVVFYEGPELDNLDDVVVLFHAYAIRVYNDIP